MAKLIEQPEQIKTELKDKWLDYYEVNKNWLQSFMDKNNSWVVNVHYEGELENSKYKPRRPNSHFILGVVTTLEPQIKGLLVFSINLQTDANQILKALDLDFDPEIELKKRLEKAKTAAEDLDKIREEIKT